MCQINPQPVRFHTCTKKQLNQINVTSKKKKTLKKKFLVAPKIEAPKKKIKEFQQKLLTRWWYNSPHGGFESSVLLMRHIQSGHGYEYIESFGLFNSNPFRALCDRRVSICRLKAFQLNTHIQAHKNNVKTNS